MNILSESPIYVQKQLLLLLSDGPVKSVQMTQAMYLMQVVKEGQLWLVRGQLVVCHGPRPSRSILLPYDHPVWHSDRLKKTKLLCSLTVILVFLLYALVVILISCVHCLYWRLFLLHYMHYSLIHLSDLIIKSELPALDFVSILFIEFFISRPPTDSYSGERRGSNIQPQPGRQHQQIPRHHLSHPQGKTLEHTERCSSAPGRDGLSRDCQMRSSAAVWITSAHI